MPLSRRALLAAPASLLAQAPARLEIESVKASPLPLLPTSRFGTNKFTGDHDPARFRSFGPFSQLAGAILVEVRTKNGPTGFGMGGGGTAAIHIIDNHLKDLLIGANALNIELLWDQIFASTSLYGRRGLPIMALSGIDLALWDIAGKHANKPVYQLWGGPAREKALSYYTGPDIDRALSLGFQAFKLPMPHGPAPERKVTLENLAKAVGLVKTARQKIGPDPLLMIDCLCRWDVPFTLAFAEKAADVKLHFIEEPLLPDDTPGHQTLVKQIKTTKIALGEHEFTSYSARQAIQNKITHYLQPDVTWCGGLTDCRRTATLAAAAGIPVYPHRGGSLFGIHLVLGHPNCPLAESFGVAEPGNEMMQRLSAPFKDGYYLAPTRPGLGHTL